MEKHYYIYRYVYPDIPWVYVGKSSVSVFSRVKSHDNKAEDNIDRKYEKLLRQSAVYYFECSSEKNMTVTEAYLIKKYRPMLNAKIEPYDDSMKEFVEINNWIPFYDRVNECIEGSSDEDDITDVKQILHRYDYRKDNWIAEVDSVRTYYLTYFALDILDGGTTGGCCYVNGRQMKRFVEGNVSIDGGNFLFSRIGGAEDYYIKDGRSIEFFQIDLEDLCNMCGGLRNIFKILESLHNQAEEEVKKISIKDNPFLAEIFPEFEKINEYYLPKGETA